MRPSNPEHSFLRHAYRAHETVVAAHHTGSALILQARKNPRNRVCWHLAAKPRRVRRCMLPRKHTG